MSEEIMKAIKDIRESDCGAWLKDCRTGLFSCADGREKRYELSRLLDALYRAAKVGPTPSNQNGGKDSE